MTSKKTSTNELGDRFIPDIDIEPTIVDFVVIIALAVLLAKALL